MIKKHQIITYKMLNYLFIYFFRLTNGLFDL